MQYKIKPFEELDIIDDYLVNVQKAIVGVAPLRRGIRLDLEILEFEEDTDLVTKNIYDIEPNKRKDIDIIKHNRFYQAKIDSRNLQAGETDFVRLPNLFVMMITNYDPFGYDYMLYTVHNKCNEVPEMAYKDGLQFLYFNTTGTKGVMNP